jgi:hypothetical protein
MYCVLPIRCWKDPALEIYYCIDQLDAFSTEHRMVMKSADCIYYSSYCLVCFVTFFLRVSHSFRNYPTPGYIPRRNALACTAPQYQYLKSRMDRNHSGRRQVPTFLELLAKDYIISGGFGLSLKRLSIAGDAYRYLPGSQRG